MAIWQFYLKIIPKKGIIEKLGFVPKKITSFIDAEGFRQYSILNPDTTIEEAFDNQKLWDSTDVEPMKIIQQIDEYVKRRTYREKNDFIFSWKTYVRYEIDNDAWLELNEQSGKIEHLSFRADLRDKSLTFLQQMVQLAKLYDCLLLDSKGNLCEPNMYDVLQIIKLSNTFRFLQNPKQFFTDLQDGTLKIE
jgi:hypothetical protein